MPESIKKRITKSGMKDIHRINILIALFIFLCSLFYLFLFENKAIMLLMAVKSGSYIYIAGTLHASIFRYCASKYDTNFLKFRLYRYLLSYSSGITLYLFFWYLFASFAAIFDKNNTLKSSLLFIMIAIIITTIILALHDFVSIRQSKIQTDLENYRLQMKNTEAENLLLKQQIQPHFLFNSLNTMKALYKTNPEKGEEYLIQLSDFLRVAVSHNKKFTATLKEELTICKNYLEMQKMRFGESLKWGILIENKERLSNYLPSFSLQPLIENAIKHNLLTKQKPLTIIIRQYDDCVEVSNNIFSKEHDGYSLGSGLGNLAERYQLLTNEEISVKNDGKIFSVNFKIIENENSNHRR